MPQNSAVEESVTKIRTMAKFEGLDRERAESEARAWDEADIREEAERTRAEAGENSKDDTEAV